MTFTESAAVSPLDDLDPAALAVPPIVKIAAGASMVAGAFTLGLGAQTALMFRMRGPVPLVVATMVLLGAVTFGAGLGGLRGKAGGTIAGAVTAGAIALLGSIWAVFAAAQGLVSPLSFGIVILGIAAAVLSGVAIGPARRVTLARAALRAKGFDFGI